MTRKFVRPHGDVDDAGQAALIMCEHHNAGHVARLFGVSRATVIRYSIRGPWPHAQPPTSGHPAPWFCDHDVARITGLISREDGDGGGG